MSFDIRHGKILGTAGIEGNGQSQPIEVLTGLREPESMKMVLNGKEVTGNCRDLLQDGIGHIPEGRLSMGLVKGMPIMGNMILGYHRELDFCRKSSLLGKRSIFRYAQKLKDKLQVRAPNMEAAVSSLSEGNQQKIIITRTFSRDPKAITITHPARRVDIGTMEYIYSQLIELRDQGTAILSIFTNLDEVRTSSDRFLMIYEDKIVSESMPGELGEVEIGLLMTGGHTMVEKEVQT